MNKFIGSIQSIVLLILLLYSRIVYSALLTTIPSFSSDIPIINATTESSFTCSLGYFRCNSTMQCIEQKDNCDGKVDCDDQSDEWNCENKAERSFWDHLFRKNPAALSDDLIGMPCVWETYTSNTCECRYNELLCQFKDLQQLPQYLPKGNIALLDLTGNYFPIISRNFFYSLTEIIVSLDTLVLNHCSIELIEPFAFYTLDVMTLYVLHLEQNFINTLPDEFFPQNNTLFELYLSGNQIRHLNRNSFINLDFLVILDLRSNRIIQFTSDVFKTLIHLQKLYLMNNQIIEINTDMFPVTMESLEVLSLAENRIHYIEKNAFQIENLNTLFLSDNKLRIISNDTFKSLPNLIALNLNNNEIEQFELGSFQGIEKLKSLFLVGNKFEMINYLILKNLTKLEFIYFTSFKFCKSALHVRNCEPRGDGISSTKHLLDNIILRGSVWIMASIAIIGNIVVLLGRLIGSTKRSQGHIEHSLYLRHLAASDLLMGIYLAIIATADITYRGKYILYDEDWRHSSICALCGFLSTLSCQSSTYLLTLVTWDRLISVTRPLQPKTSSKFRAISRLVILWGTAGLAAASPLSTDKYFGEHFYGTNGVCLSIHIHEPFAKGWEYSATMFILINAASLFFIVISYLRMLQAIRGSGEGMRSTLSGRESVVATRFAIIVATDCSCWLPVIIVKVCALCGVIISPALYAWLAVLVLPVNSALNPILYTLTTASFKQQISKCIYSLPCGGDILSKQPSGYESALTVSLPITGSTRKHVFRERTAKSSFIITNNNNNNNNI